MFADIKLFYPNPRIPGTSLDFNRDDIIKSIEFGYETAKTQYGNKL